MIFSSLIFLYLFLPLTLLAYYLLPKTFRNYWLLAASFVFFAWGGVSYTVILIGSIVANYFFGLLIQKYIDRPGARYWLFAGVFVNLLLLGIFKYANFIVRNLNDLLGLVALPKMHQTDILLPIGISFYTFHSLSYLIDIYRRKATAQRNIFDLSLYIAMFSQLVAGPIIRYGDVWLQLEHREHSWVKFAEGCERFLIGLGKKVLLANTFGNITDRLFKLDPAELGAMNAWLGIVCYTFQIYCDFAGYSDMAIGIGKMFGFDFLENFNFPFLARSIREFWRRWHISLSSFFRDYVYIPLGGNNVRTVRMYFNLVFVFCLVGFWHGAGWNYIVFGLAHGFFMVIERVFLEKMLFRIWRPLANLYTFLVLALTFVIFHTDTLTQAGNYWKAMFDLTGSTAGQKSIFYGFMNNEFFAALTIAVLGSFGAFKRIEPYIEKIMLSEKLPQRVFSRFYDVASAIAYALTLLLSSMYLVAGHYNPFIYYRF